MNLRATRATELRRHFPEEVVTDWCGHTEAIASDHYWMTLQDDYTKAACFKSDAYLMQQGVVNGRNGLQSPQEAQKESPDFPGLATTCDDSQGHPMDLTGLEPVATSAGKTQRTVESNRDSDAYVMQTSCKWDQIRTLIADCPDLPTEARRSLIAQGDEVVASS
jgi:hypothetical protein